MNDKIADNTAGSLRSYLEQELSAVYADDRERNNIVRELFRHYLGWSGADLALRKNERLSESEILDLHFALKRLRTHEPLQYITGVAHFMGMDLQVNKHVLIPRPETEELVGHILNSGLPEQLNVLDIGTGSGCIALALKQNRPSWQVTAVDVSPDALALARENALTRKLDITWTQLNILEDIPSGKFDLIVSNPPYIQGSESATMADRIVRFEPPVALFVPDQDPLIFYRRILELLPNILGDHGQIWLECHESYCEETAQLYRSAGFNAQVHSDLQGKNRMVSAIVN